MIRLLGVKYGGLTAKLRCLKNSSVPGAIYQLHHPNSILIPYWVFYFDSCCVAQHWCNLPAGTDANFSRMARIWRLRNLHHKVN